MTRGNISDVDGLPYTTLSYATGPGYTVHNVAQTIRRKNLTNVDTRKSIHQLLYGVLWRRGRPAVCHAQLRHRAGVHST